ncbi:hypothetical protein POSPLADRAFT_1044941 [Postia placenta MAD-698-R-SB12]|uniref:Uncharacterized protein n=1 Tax=Postia placenta MAD-698-R-SB12 TaxID=670580 RepID=A0A1X6NB62_9APHY|nr:hypothetical protein POSPLADRAFT_1044941 [Postia placenta MAD-698-R-SB12]OSX65613.1 hypothetical protein POSPLADRAFT_1044941 [Postia placenta MAD-698-R-SB12]
MTVEDGAVLAKLFARLRNRDQIESFLYAFQDLRQQRCRDTVKSEIGLMQLFVLEDGPEREARDNDMLAKHREGKGVLELEDGEEPRGLAGQQWSEIRDIFGYDCEDEADNCHRKIIGVHLAKCSDGILGSDVTGNKATSALISKFGSRTSRIFMSKHPRGIMGYKFFWVHMGKAHYGVYDANISSSEYTIRYVISSIYYFSVGVPPLHKPGLVLLQ